MPDTMSAEIAGKIRLFKRLIMSYADFKHARLAAEQILDEDLHAKYPDESYVTLPALNCSMIISYCRPFSGNSAAVPDLPGRLLRELTPEERVIHEQALHDRNKVLAHSDAEVIDPEPVLMQLEDDSRVLVPIVNWGLAPLTREATVILHSAASKLFERTLSYRLELEPELRPFFRVVGPKQVFDRPA